MQAGGTPTNGPNTLFSTIDVGANVSLFFPQFLIPYKPELFLESFKPRTVVSVGYNYQHQSDYDRHVSNISFGYSWWQNEKIRHELYPAEVTLVKVLPSAAFTEWLDTLKDKRLKNQYTDHLVAGSGTLLLTTISRLERCETSFTCAPTSKRGGTSSTRWMSCLK